MIYKEYREKNKIPENTPVWACAYRTNSMKEDMGLYCLPVKGEIIHGTFYPYGKKTKFIKSRSVDLQSRGYADTYDECVQLYNSYIQNRIDWLQDILKEASNDFIKIN